MANPKTLLRKTPPERLRDFFTRRLYRCPPDFNWGFTGKALVDALDLLLKDQPQQREDEIRAELDRIAGLSERDGWAALEERCRAEHIDLDAREGPEDAVFMLALDHADVFEQIVSAASLKRRNGGRDWSQFGFLDPATSLTIDDPVAREEFVHRSMEILKVAAGRRYEADWYDIIREDPATWQHLRVSQVTIYVEERPEATLAFDETSTVQRRVVPKVAEVSFGWDHEHALFDVCAAGGFSKRSEYATAFASAFLGTGTEPVAVPPRRVNFTPLHRPTDFRLDPKDGVESVEVSELGFWHTAGGFATYQNRSRELDIYDFLDRTLGSLSPLHASGWKMTTATIRIRHAPKDGRKRTLVIDLKSPNRTTLRNKTEKDRSFVTGLLERWGLLEPLFMPDPVVEDN